MSIVRPNLVRDGAGVAFAYAYTTEKISWPEMPAFGAISVLVFARSHDSCSCRLRA